MAEVVPTPSSTKHTSSRRQRRLTAFLTASHSCDNASVSSLEAPGSTHPVRERSRRKQVDRETAVFFQFLEVGEEGTVETPSSLMQKTSNRD